LVGSATLGYDDPVDRQSKQLELLMVLRHVEQGERLVHEQESRIADMDRRGHDTAEAKRLLNLLRDTQDKHTDHRTRLFQEMWSR
jgi:hypothetical protein